MNLHAALATIESVIGDPHQGLPEDVFLLVSRITPLVNVDLLIQDDGGRTLLTWRDDEFFGTGWHVPGGIIRYKDMAANRIQACALEELGANVVCDAAPLLVAESIQSQRNRGHLVSLLYRCRLLTPLDQNLRARSSPPNPGQWEWHEGCPPDLLPVQTQYRRFF